MTGVDADLATLRDSLDFMESVIRSGEAYTETVIAQGMDAATALDRLGAELARLTARRSRYAEARYENCMEALSAAEARCARLQQALEPARVIVNKLIKGSYGNATITKAEIDALREALAGTDTLTAGDQGERPDGTGRVAPADGCAERQSTADPSPAASAGPDTPADSQEDKT